MAFAMIAAVHCLLIISRCQKQNGQCQDSGVFYGNARYSVGVHVLLVHVCIKLYDYRSSRRSNNLI